MTETLDIDTPEGARKYIAYAADNLLPGRKIDQVTLGKIDGNEYECGEVVHFSNMTDEQAVRVARSLYLDIEIPASKGAPKQ